MKKPNKNVVCSRKSIKSCREMWKQIDKRLIPPFFVIIFIVWTCAITGKLVITRWWQQDIISSRSKSAHWVTGTVSTHTTCAKVDPKRSNKTISLWARSWWTHDGVWHKMIGFRLDEIINQPIKKACPHTWTADEKLLAKSIFDTLNVILDTFFLCVTKTQDEPVSSSIDVHPLILSSDFGLILRTFASNMANISRVISQAMALCVLTKVRKLLSSPSFVNWANKNDWSISFFFQNNKNVSSWRVCVRARTLKDKMPAGRPVLCIRPNKKCTIYPIQLEGA